MAILQKAPQTSKRIPTHTKYADEQESYNFIDLPLTRLHYIECGSGPPLVMMPATISDIRNWKSLIEFMGQKFTVYFFELPGHGKSSPFREPFNTDLVAQTVLDFIDKMGFEKVSLMGFSFGGILTMKTLTCLDNRVERLILLSPCLTHQALNFKPIYKKLLRSLAETLKSPRVCQCLIYLIQETKFHSLIVSLLRKIGKLEPTIPLEKRLLEIQPPTIQIVVYQLSEILSFSSPIGKPKYTQPCYFMMSVLDPVLSFERTKTEVGKLFKNFQMQELFLPYHQPKEIPSVEEMNRDYRSFFQMLDDDYDN